MQQRQRKTSQLVALLEASDVRFPPPIWLGELTEGYRNRIRLAISDGVPAFFNQEKSWACAVLAPELKELLQRFLLWASPQRHALQPYVVAELRVPDADTRPAIYLKHTNGNERQTPPPPPAPRLTPFSNAYLAWEGGPVRRQRFVSPLGGYTLVPVGGFMQVNTHANSLMVRQVIAWANALKARSFLDLYAGSGNFSIPLAHNGLSGVSVERDQTASAAQSQACAEQGLRGCTVICHDALDQAAKLLETRRRFDLVVVDPPRAGLRGRVSEIVAASKQAVVLAFCNPQRFAHDASALTRAGFELTELRLIDMFPHTNHVEVLALFTPPSLGPSATQPERGTAHSLL